MFENISTNDIDLPIPLDVDDCISDALPPSLTEISSRIEGIADSLQDHLRDTHVALRKAERLRFRIDVPARPMKAGQRIRVIIRWTEVKRIEDTFHLTMGRPASRPRVVVEPDQDLGLIARAEMSSHVKVLEQGALFELPFTLLPYQPIVVRWRLKDSPETNDKPTVPAS